MRWTHFAIIAAKLRKNPELSKLFCIFVKNYAERRAAGGERREEKCVTRTSYINVTQERASGGREQGARGYWESAQNGAVRYWKSIRNGALYYWKSVKKQIFLAYVRKIMYLCSIMTLSIITINLNNAG